MSPQWSNRRQTTRASLWTTASAHHVPRRTACSPSMREETLPLFFPASRSLDLSNNWLYATKRYAPHVLSNFRTEQHIRKYLWNHVLTMFWRSSYAKLEPYRNKHAVKTQNHRVLNLIHMHLLTYHCTGSCLSLNWLYQSLHLPKI